MAERQVDGQLLSSGEEKTELPQSVRDCIREMHQRWDDRLKWEHVNFAEVYIGGKIDLTLCINAPSLFDGNDPCYSVKAGFCKEPFSRVQGHIGKVDQHNAVNRAGMSDGRDDSVFVSIVELIEGVEGLTYTRRVNRKIDKKLPRVLPGCLHSARRGFVTDPVVPSGQFCVSVLCTAVDADQFPYRVVERGPKVVYGVTNDHRQLSWQFPSELDLEPDGDCLATFVTHYGPRTMGARLLKGAEPRLQVSDMLFGPF